MILVASLLVLAVRAERPEPAVLDVRWLPELGLVTLSADSARLDLRIEKDGTSRSQSFQLDAPVREARSGPWMGKGIVVALSMEEGETTSYRYLASSTAPTGHPTIGSIDFRSPAGFWFLSKPIFASTGERYRIVAVNDHLGPDEGLEITFRRGWMKRAAEMERVDEKILFDSCGISTYEPLQEGRAVLFETSKLRRDGGESPR